MPNNEIEMYVHCGHCIDAGERNPIEVGLTKERLLRINCQEHGLITELALAPETIAKLSGLKCAMCEQGVPHHH